jgi:two-component system chemotaxis sensor kinase CheA
LSTLEDQLKQLTAALDALRVSRVDGPQTRKALDDLFRRTHNLKAAAAAEGLHEVSSAAHELENVLHSLRTGTSTLDDHVLQQLTEKSTAILRAEERHSLAQAVTEGANVFLVQTSFDVTDFDQGFQKLKQILSNSGELISITPRTENNKINFQILYAGDLPPELAEISNVTVAELRQRETISLAIVMQRAVRAGQSAAATLGKKIDFELHDEDLSLEESLCRVVADPLMHLVRNAVDHGIEHDGKITIEAIQDDDELKIKVTDDGRGIDPETIATIFDPGFSTASEVSEISGRGVGLDVVKTTIEDAGGSVKVITELGHGTTFELILPRMNAD